VKTTSFLLALAFLSIPSFSQPQADAKTRARNARDLAKQGEEAIPKLEPYLTDSDLNVRLEAVKALDEIGGPKTVDLLVRAARDNDPEVQVRATDGLVNVYLPGYLKTGISGTISRAGNSIKAKFTDTNDQVIDPYIEVRPEVITALGRIAANGASLESRANACRGLGILRGRAALDGIVEALHSKDNQVMYEGLIAVQKIRDPAAGPRIQFLLRDLDERVQLAAIETVGLLRDQSAAAGLRDALEHARTIKVKRAAVTSLAMLGDPTDHALFVKYLSDPDDLLRGAGAEGLGRLKNASDKPALEKAFNAEKKQSPRLSLAFALVSLGDVSMGEFAPLRYLVNTLNLKSYRGVANPFLSELARDMAVRQALYPVLTSATKDEKIQLGIVLARSGDKDSLPFLETLQRDPDTEVAQESVRSLRALRARLP
jgi:HEAT repeat protein